MDREFVEQIETLIYRLKYFPADAWKDLQQSLETIERKYDLFEEEPTAEDRRDIEEGRKEFARGEFVTFEEFLTEQGLEQFDWEAASRERLADAVKKIKKLDDREQGNIANVLFALLDAAD